MGTVPNIIKSAGNQFVTTLASGVNDSVTSIQLTSTTGLNPKGVLIFDEGNANEEIIYYESYAGTTLTIASNGRGYAGTTAASHSAGATVTDVLVQSHINGLADKFLIEHTDTGTHGTITGATLTTPVIASFYQDSGLTKLMTVPNVASDTLVTLAATQTLTGKTLTTPTITGGTLTSSTVTTPTLELANTSPTADGGIGFDRTTEDLQVGDGTNSQKVHMGTWTTFTPSWTNVTTGNGTNAGAYCKIGKTVIGYAQFSFGSTSSVGGNISLAAPLAVATGTSGTGAAIGRIIYEDSGTGFNFGIWLATGAVYALNTGGTYASLTQSTSTIPQTFTTNDKIRVEFRYETSA